MKLKALLALSILFYIPPLMSAPRASSQQECFYVSDMALTARALSIEGIEEPVALKILSHMYKGEAASPWINVVLAGARSDKRGAGDYARAFYEHCTSNRGNVDAFFGVGA